MSDANQTSEISLRLANTEKIINLLFGLPNSCTSAILEKKLTQFEELIALYPDSANDMADEARAKVVSMWYRIYNTARPHQNSSSESEDFRRDRMMNENVTNSSEKLRENSCSKSDLENDFIFSNKTELQPRADEACSFTNSATIPKRHILPFAQTVKIENNADWRLELQQYFKKSFASLKVVESGVNVEDIKELLQVSARAKMELSHYPKDAQLHFNIFNMAFNKLSIHLRQHYMEHYFSNFPSGINLVNLIALLEAEIVAQHTKKISLMSTIHHQKLKRTSRQSNLFSSMLMAPRHSIIFCKYCKSSEHNRDNCPNAMKLLCFRCYGNGHTKRDCMFGRY